MIHCSHCRHPNPENLQYCHRCGKPLKTSFDQVQQSLHEDARNERRTHTHHELNRWLFLVVFLLLATLGLRIILPREDWMLSRPPPLTATELLPPPLPVIFIPPLGHQQLHPPRQGDRH